MGNTKTIEKPPATPMIESGISRTEFLNADASPMIKEATNPIQGPAGIKWGVSDGYQSVAGYQGLVKRGTMNLSKRQIVDNADGSYGTELSMGYGDGRYQYIIPTIFDGKINEPEEAIARFKKTGEHMGAFDYLVEEASGFKNSDAYSQKLHNRAIIVDGKRYFGKGGK